MNAEVKIHLKGLYDYVNKLNRTSQLMRKLAAVLARGIRRRVRRGEIEPKSHRAQVEGGKTLLDTGRMLKSIRVVLVTNGKAIIAAGGGDVKYAAIHHSGGTLHNVFIPLFRITGSKRAHTPIRIKDMLANRGTGPRGGRILVVEYPAELRGARAFWKTSRHGNRILFAAKDGKLVPLFVFKPEVKIPPRRWFAADERTLDEMRRAAQEWTGGAQ